MPYPVRFLCALSLGGALLLASRPAFACSCAFPSIAEARAAAAAVFEGRALSVSGVKGGDAGPEAATREITLAVVRTWKGLQRDERVVVRTLAESSLCGYAFSTGKSYLVYADAEPGGLGVNACSRTRAIADAREDLIALGAGSTPVKVVSKSASDAGVPADGGALAVASPTSTPMDGGLAADAGHAALSALIADAGSAAKPPPAKAGGCASTRGQASLAPYLLGIPALAGWRRRRARTVTRS